MNRARSEPAETSAGALGLTSVAAAPSEALDHAVRIIHAVCCLAGRSDPSDWVDSASGLSAAIAQHDNEAVFDWLVSSLAYQGIANSLAYEYMQRHGRVTWRDLVAARFESASCDKLESYWAFHGCRYRKLRSSCAHPDRLPDCPVPRFPLRNGRLNETATSLFLFVRDLAQGDLIGWIDAQLDAARADSGRLAPETLAAALIDPLRNIHGVSDKLLTMVLSTILLSADTSRPGWREVGASMIVIDTLVHKFLHRTGILARFGASHAYGAACYRAGNCAAIIRAAAQRLDVRQFNPAFPEVFPRFVQVAIWRYCAQDEYDICNGNKINDRNSCDNIYCRLRSICDRISLY